MTAGLGDTASSSDRTNFKSVTLTVLLARIGRCLGALVHAVVAQHLGDAQAVVAKHAVAAGLLGRAVMLDVAPRRHRRLVAPEGKRQELGLVHEALEPLDADEAVDALQLG